KQLRTFSPVILFHDHQYVNAGSGDMEHIHIPYGDPSYGRHLDIHKKRIHEMLENNDHPESLDHSPVPSLVSSPSPPHHHQDESMMMREDNYRMRKHMTVSNTKKASTTNKRRRGNLPKAVTAILRDWLSRHKKHPYPTEEEKAALAAETNLNLNQISNWFINARRRILQPMLEQEEEEKSELDIIMPYDNRHLGM
ncbi:Homeodomain-like protein, partial [Backusella circina FSU 941]